MKIFEIILQFSDNEKHDLNEPENWDESWEFPEKMRKH